MKFYGLDTTARAGRTRPVFFDDPAFASFLEGLPEGAALIELDGRIRLVNSALERLLRLSRADLVGTDLARHLRGADPELGAIAQSLLQLRRTEATGRLGSGRQVAARLSILRTAGEAYGALFTLREAAGSAVSAPRAGQFRFAREASAAPLYLESPLRRTLAETLRAGLGQGLRIALSGPTGAGKTTLLRRVAGAQGGPVASLACAALTAESFERELFGAGAEAPGAFAAAQGGALILDGLDDLAPALQPRLAAALDRDEAGGFAILTAARSPLEAALASGALSEALYHRLAGLSRALPPLAEEPELLDPLAEAIVAARARARGEGPALSAAARKALRARAWPGNLRELATALGCAALAAEAAGAARIEPAHLPPEAPPAPAPGAAPYAAASPFPAPSPAPAPGAAGPLPEDLSLRALVQAFESRVIEISVAQNGSKRSAAKALGIDIATLVRKTKRARSPTNKE